jgi:hypothetical protein
VRERLDVRRLLDARGNQMRGAYRGVDAEFLEYFDAVGILDDGDSFFDPIQALRCLAYDEIRCVVLAQRDDEVEISDLCLVKDVLFARVPVNDGYVVRAREVSCCSPDRR